MDVQFLYDDPCDSRTPINPLSHPRIGKTILLDSGILSPFHSSPPRVRLESQLINHQTPKSEPDSPIQSCRCGFPPAVSQYRRISRQRLGNRQGNECCWEMRIRLRRSELRWMEHSAARFLHPTVDQNLISLHRDMHKD